MGVIKSKAVAAGVAVAVSLLAQPALADKSAAVARSAEEGKAPAANKSRRAVKLDLTTENFARMHALIRPHEQEWRHLEVQWLTDVVAVRRIITVSSGVARRPVAACTAVGPCQRSQAWRRSVSRRVTSWCACSRVSRPRARHRRRSATSRPRRPGHSGCGVG